MIHLKSFNQMHFLHSFMLKLFVFFCSSSIIAFMSQTRCFSIFFLLDSYIVMNYSNLTIHTLIISIYLSQLSEQVAFKFHRLRIQCFLSIGFPSFQIKFIFKPLLSGHQNRFTFLLIIQIYFHVTRIDLFSFQQSKFTFMSIVISISQIKILLSKFRI